MGKNVGIVIVSHSPDVAKGAADMVRQMVGAHVPLAWCGGNPAGDPSPAATDRPGSSRRTPRRHGVLLRVATTGSDGGGGALPLCPHRTGNPFFSPFPLWRPVQTPAIRAAPAIPRAGGPADAMIAVCAGCWCHRPMLEIRKATS